MRHALTLQARHACMSLRRSFDIPRPIYCLVCPVYIVCQNSYSAPIIHIALIRRHFHGLRPSSKMLSSRQPCLACIAREFERDRSFERDHEFLAIEGDELSPIRFHVPPKLGSWCQCSFSAIPGTVGHVSEERIVGFQPVRNGLPEFYPLPPSISGPFRMDGWVWPGLPPWSLGPIGNRAVTQDAPAHTASMSTLDLKVQQSIDDDDGDFPHLLFPDPDISATTAQPLEQGETQRAAILSRSPSTWSRASSPLLESSATPKPLTHSEELSTDMTIPGLEHLPSSRVDGVASRTDYVRRDSVSSPPYSYQESRRLSALAEVFVPATAAAATARGRHSV